MANHKQAIKRHRQSLGRADLNAYYKATMRTFLKKARAAIEGGDKAVATEATKKAISWMDHVASKGAVPKLRVDRLKGRLASKLAKLA
ncbi:MAG: small subunit ribosomal protein S20 [Myxococcota bacterium]|jgi:small subunit ribosomal protein S20